MNKVIACIDTFNHTAETVCDFAAWSSQRLQAPLLLLHVLEKSDQPAKTNLSGTIGLGTQEQLLDELSQLDEQRARLLKEQGRVMLKEAWKRATEDGIADAETLQLHGDLIETIAELEQDIRLLVMGREGSHEHSTAQIGSHLESVIRTLHRPILITVADFKSPERFMIAYDGSETAKKAIQMVASSPLLQGIPCTLLTVGPDTNNLHEQLKEAAVTLEKAGFNVTPVLRAGEVDKVINQCVEVFGIDLLVMGAYGHSRIRQFLVGSTTTRLLQHSRIPVLLLR
ncbi:MAG: universal stress protein [Nitrincola lacisaponensis]|uniref:universal stress protein n=1 Tax=Nitrincola lacisaponensis TaxID=267850 RepID=UPI00391C2BDA